MPGVVDADDHRQVGVLLQERLGGFQAFCLLDRLRFERLDTGGFDDGRPDRIGAIRARLPALVVGEQRPAKFSLSPV